MTTIDFAIVTHRPEGIFNLAKCDLPILDGVRYVVSWQNHGDTPIPESLKRDDVEIHRFSGIGLSANRNNALEYCRAKVIVFADDDLTFFVDGIRELQNVYSENPEIDLIVTRAIHGEKRMPNDKVMLNQYIPKGFYVSSIELSFRRSCGLRCCPEVGLGAPSGIESGEDELLFTTALRRGMICWYFPITVCKHEHPSTGTKAALTPGSLRGSGCVIAISYPLPEAAIRLGLKIWRVWRSGRASFWSAVRNIIAGASASGGVRRRNRKYLW